MKTACATQCTACPFRSTCPPGWLGGYEEPGVVLSSLWHHEPFFCHTRVNYEKSNWLEKAMANGPLCLGALVMLGRSGWGGESPDPEVRAAIAEAMAKADADPAAFDVLGPKEFAEHHRQDRAAWLARQPAADAGE